MKILLVLLITGLVIGLGHQDYLHASQSGFSVGVNNTIARWQAGPPFPDEALLWPTPGFWGISSVFGPRNKSFHSGIDIKASEGSSVIAVEGGEVHINWELNGYGKTVTINHANNYSTWYTHLRTSKVWSGKKVERGDEIGEVGQTGRVGGPHLHFEIRQNDRPIDPLEFYLHLEDRINLP